MTLIVAKRTNSTVWLTLPPLKNKKKKKKNHNNILPCIIKFHEMMKYP